MNALVLAIVIVVVLLILFLYYSKNSTKRTARQTTYVPSTTFTPIGYGEDVATTTLKFWGQLSYPTQNIAAVYPAFPQTNMMNAVLFGCPYFGTQQNGYLGVGQTSTCNYASMTQQLPQVPNSEGVLTDPISPWVNNQLFTDMTTECSVQINGTTYTLPLGLANYMALANWYGFSWYGVPNGDTNVATSNPMVMAGPEWLSNWISTYQVGTYGWAAGGWAMPNVGNPGSGTTVYNVIGKILSYIMGDAVII